MTAADGKAKAMQSAFLKRIAAASSRRLHKNRVGLMAETINPLWNINQRWAQQIYDFARSGNYAQIQYLYNEIEERDPTLLVCVTRRTSAVAELDWRVVRSDQRLNRDIDQKLVEDQIACVETAIAKIDNMPDALEHLALSAFRGFSAVAPVHNLGNDEIRHLDLIDGWNLCFDRVGQTWLFNPSATSFAMPTALTANSCNIGEARGLQPIPREEMCIVTRKREIDWPAMQIYLRSAVGERDWGRFLETYGLPPVIITMPEFTSKDDQDAYIEASEAVFEGRSGVVPYGSVVNYASESRGTNPFTEFIEHQQKLIVMMSTGGTLASLAESGSGTLAGDAQQDEWKRIIRADKRIISNAINKQLCEPILRAAFPGKPILAEFQLDDTPKPTAKEMLELAGLASSAGFEFDAKELSRACGYTIRKKSEGGMGFNASVPAAESPAVTAEDEGTDPNAGEVTEPVATNATADAPVSAPVAPEEAVPNEDASVTTEAVEAPSRASAEKRSIGEDLVRTLQDDFKPVADRIVAILALPENERPGAAVKLMQELDALVPQDPSMAQVIEEQMREAFDLQVRREPNGDAPASNGVVSNSKEQ